jgi:hypothetical protein
VHGERASTRDVGCIGYSCGFLKQRSLKSPTDGFFPNRPALKRSRFNNLGQFDSPKESTVLNYEQSGINEKRK